ncbi:uncharacterized protein LOC122243108 [Penaeus japonicus]|uniref:uncharacterized protein LOC122243108 n=1 Tax=Penaeus japonicus TaxID=27405 RepID=UPI001C713957|nr:uncharacterized protein LOC122243108 [Penaeus japonicus]
MSGEPAPRPSDSDESVMEVEAENAQQAASTTEGCGSAESTVPRVRGPGINPDCTKGEGCGSAESTVPRVRGPGINPDCTKGEGCGSAESTVPRVRGPGINPGCTKGEVYTPKNENLGGVFEKQCSMQDDGGPVARRPVKGKKAKEMKPLHNLDLFFKMEKKVQETPEDHESDEESHLDDYQDDLEDHPQGRKKKVGRGKQKSLDPYNRKGPYDPLK